LRNSNNKIFDEDSGFGPNALSNFETPGLELLIKHTSEERVVGTDFSIRRGDEKEKARLVAEGRALAEMR
jgi:hypothetical protein